MEVAVIALPHLIPLQQFHNFLAQISLIPGRIVEKAQLLPLPRCLKRRLQPDQLPLEHLLGLGRSVLLKKPAPGAAQGGISVEGAVVVEDVKLVKAVFGKKAVHLGRGGPPVIVVALEQPFLPRQGVEKRKIRFRLLQRHAPGNVAAQHHGVLLRYG